MLPVYLDHNIVSFPPDSGISYVSIGHRIAGGRSIGGTFTASVPETAKQTRSAIGDESIPSLL
eukprot:156433-Rhodomonas_salina.1